MKKVILSIILIVLLIAGLFVLTGCGNKTEEKEVTPQTEDNVGTKPAEKDEDKPLYSSDSVYDYELGTLCQITKDLKPVAPDFTIDGIILCGNRHADYSIETLMQEGYKTYDLKSTFYLNEQIEFYMDTKYSGKDSDVKILITPHDIIENYDKMSFSEITDLASEKGCVIDYSAPEKASYNYVGNGYVSMDYPKGKYDVLFFYKGTLAYYICIDLVDEPVE